MALHSNNTPNQLASKAWHQSHMFSSTAQILEVYLAASPMLSTNGSIEMKWTPTSAGIGEGKVAEKKQQSQIYHSPYLSVTTPQLSSTDSSPASSPASSHTAYSNDGRSPKKSASLEIRRRRLPEGVEPRVKNLSLTKSNGATRLLPPPPIHDVALTAASSNYSQSPPMDSPDNHPPPPPPKAAGRSLPRKPINRKPLQMNQEPLQGPSILPEIGISLGAKNEVTQAQEQSQPASKTTPPNLAQLPPRSTSLSNPHQTDVGKKPVIGHKKTLSMASLNKDLPPDPTIDRSLLPKRGNSTGLTMSPTSELVEIAIPPSRVNPVHSHSRSDPSTELRGLPSGPKGLPAGPKLPATVPPRAIPEKEEPKDQTAEPVKKPLSRGGPALGSLSSGPRPKTKPKHQVSASESILTSATISGPIPLPDFQVHRRAESDVNKSSLRTHTREKSLSESTSGEMITIAMDPRPVQTHRPTPSQASIRSELSQISRSTTPLSQKSASTAPTSISSLPDVPEVRTPLFAPELKDSHFTCYTQHRPLVASSNHIAPILCMTCNADADKMWACGWCHLRICTGCKDALVEVKNNLRKMLDESKAGTLIIGKERIPNPPFMSDNGPRSHGSDTSSVRSNRSAGSRPLHSRGPVFAPPQPPRLRHERSMDSLQSRGAGRGPYGPLRNNRGPPPPIHGQPLDYIGMPTMMNGRTRQPPPPPPGISSNGPKSPKMITPTFGPVSLGFPTNNPMNRPPPNSQLQTRNFQGNQFQNNNNTRRPPGPQRPKFDDDGEDYMPMMLDLSLDAGAGPMAAGLRGFNLGGASRPVNVFGTGNSPYQPPPPPRARGMA